MIDKVLQPTDYSCFAASLSMLTGIDVMLFDLSQEAAPTTYPSPGGMTLLPEDAIVWNPSDVTVTDWATLMHYNGYKLTVYDNPVPGVRGILTFTMVKGQGDYFSHAVAIDEQGYATCPSSTFDEMHLTEFQEACNIIISGFVTVEEHNA